jgi:iron complex outermembrane receptor protein
LVYQGDKYTWTNGIEIRFHNSNHWGKLSYAEDLPINFDPDFKFYEYDGTRNIFSAFSSFESSWTDNLLLFADAQLVYHSYGIDNEKSGKFFTSYNNSTGKTVGNGNRIFNINHIFFNPKIGMTYLINSLSSISGFLAITSREPRMSNIYSASEAFYGAKPQFEATVDSLGNIYYNFEKPLVKPETMFDFELGYNFKNEIISFTANLYYMLYRDELVKSGQLDLFGDPIDGNAPQTVHSGIELSGKIKLIHSNDYGNLDLVGNLTYSRNRIIEYDFLIGNNESISLKGNSIAGFPDLLGNLRVNYSLGDFYCSGILKYIGSSKTDNYGDMLKTNSKLKSYLEYGYYTDNNLDAFVLLNMDFAYSFQNIFDLESISVQMKVNNILNLNYASGAEGKEFYPGAERNIFFGIELGL